MESYKKLIGKKIQRRRIEKGFSSQQALADKIGVEQSQVNRWETGVHLPERTHKSSLMSVLDVPASFFELIETSNANTERLERILSLQTKIATLNFDQLLALELLIDQPNHIEAVPKITSALGPEWLEKTLRKISVDPDGLRIAIKLPISADADSKIDQTAQSTTNISARRINQK